MKCKHSTACEYLPSVQGNDIVYFTVLRCQRCGELFSLGPSDEHASEQVEIEIRAAELAARNGFGSFANCGAGCERCGFVAYKHAIECAPIHPCTLRKFDAGYLAGLIADHSETP